MSHDPTILFPSPSHPHTHMQLTYTHNSHSHALATHTHMHTHLRHTCTYPKHPTHTSHHTTHTSHTSHTHTTHTRTTHTLMHHTHTQHNHIYSNREMWFVCFMQNRRSSSLVTSMATACECSCEHQDTQRRLIPLAPRQCGRLRYIQVSYMGTGVQSRVALLTVTTTCDFERGGATKPIIGSS